MSGTRRIHDTGSRPNPLWHLIISTSGQMGSELERCLVAAQDWSPPEETLWRHRMDMRSDEWMVKVEFQVWIESFVGGKKRIYPRVIPCVCSLQHNASPEASVCARSISDQYNQWMVGRNSSPDRIFIITLWFSDTKQISFVAACLLDRSSHRRIMKLIFRCEERRGKHEPWMKSCNCMREVVPHSLTQ